MFHDQKSAGTFRLMESGLYTITKTDIVSVAKTDSVVDEKENAMNVREKNDREPDVEKDVQFLEILEYQRT